MQWRVGVRGVNYIYCHQHRFCEKLGHINRLNLALNIIFASLTIFTQHLNHYESLKYSRLFNLVIIGDTPLPLSLNSTIIKMLLIHTDVPAKLNFQLNIRCAEELFHYNLYIMLTKVLAPTYLADLIEHYQPTHILKYSHQLLLKVR